MWKPTKAQATQRRRQALWAARSVSREEASITCEGEGSGVMTWRAPFHWVQSGAWVAD